MNLRTDKMRFWRWKKNKTVHEMAYVSVSTNAVDQQGTGDESVMKAPAFNAHNACVFCLQPFHLRIRRRHHCRNCGESCCKMCLSAEKYPIPWFNMTKPQKVCQICVLRDFLPIHDAPRSESEPATIVSYPRRLTRSAVLRPTVRTYPNKLWRKIRLSAQKGRRVQVPFDTTIEKPAECS